MQEQINQLLRKRLELSLEETGTISLFREWVKDKSIPLKERWALFVYSGLGEDRIYIEQFKALDDDLIGPDGAIYADKHMTISTKRIVERIEEEKDNAGVYPSNGIYFDEELVKVDIDALKEEILKKFIKSFKFDW